jgi:hypothetical protein
MMEAIPLVKRIHFISITFLIIISCNMLNLVSIELLSFSPGLFSTSNLMRVASIQTGLDPIQGEGDMRTAQLLWHQHNQFENIKNNQNFSVDLVTGFMNNEALNFSGISPQPILLVVEDYDNPANPALDYEYISSDEYVYMSFYINGTDEVRLDGFWVYFRGETIGNLLFRVYQAEPGTQAATFPKISTPITNWIEVPIAPIIESGQERWFWLDTDENSVILDPASTYLNTFYIGITRALDTDTRIRWVYCEDNANPDNDDEGDCYRYYGGWTYRTRDLFLNVSIFPLNQDPYPSDINMRVNHEIILDLSSPNSGVWECDLLPPFEATGSTRYYNVSIDWPNFYQWPIEFDVTWSGKFFESTPVASLFYIDEERTGINWTLTLVVDFPANMKNQLLQLQVGKEWEVHSVYRNTLPFTFWSLNQRLLQIIEAEDGLWQIHCYSPNYVIDLEVKDFFNREVNVANFTSRVNIYAHIRDPFGNNVTNGEAELSIYNPENILLLNKSGLTISPEGGIIVTEWDIAATVHVEGYYTLEVTWLNGTEAGSNIKLLFVRLPISPFAFFCSVFPWIILILVILCASILFYNHRVIMPKRRSYYEYLQGLADTFDDVEKIWRILIVHKDSGLCILDPIVDEKMDANLLGGLIQAVTTLGLSFTENENEDIIHENSSPLQEITYRDFHITVQDGDYIRTAVICSSSPSKHLARHLDEFTTRFETRYESELDGWKGRMALFEDGYKLVDEAFQITLRLPHILQKMKTDIIAFSEPERAIYSVTRKLMKTQFSVYLRELINSINPNNKNGQLKFFKAVVDLREKGILTPIQTDIPYTFTN